jgi:hypothetical protein
MFHPKFMQGLSLHDALFQSLFNITFLNLWPSADPRFAFAIYAAPGTQRQLRSGAVLSATTVFSTTA